MKKVSSLLLALMLCLSLCACDIESTPDTESKEEETTPSTSAPENQPVAEWKNSIPVGVALDLEYAFLKSTKALMKSKASNILKKKATALFVRRDYKVSLTMDYTHFRWYRITNEEWNEGEPEREKYPREYLVTIKFWADDNTTNINQWIASGNGELQDASAGEYLPPAVDEVVLPTGVGESSSNPIVISAEDLVSEINIDIDAAKEKYNGKWGEITGTITFVSESAGMTGCYLY